MGMDVRGIVKEEIWDFVKFLNEHHYFIYNTSESNCLSGDSSLITGEKLSNLIKEFLESE